jgi:hypothetical protein
LAVKTSVKAKRAEDKYSPQACPNCKKVVDPPKPPVRPLAAWRWHIGGLLGLIGWSFFFTASVGPFRENLDAEKASRAFAWGAGAAVLVGIVLSQWWHSRQRRRNRDAR